MKVLEIILCYLIIETDNMFLCDITFVANYDLIKKITVQILCADISSKEMLQKFYIFQTSRILFFIFNNHK